jgi:hypothetical protein
LKVKSAKLSVCFGNVAEKGLCIVNNVRLLWEGIFLDYFSLQALEGTAVLQYQENPKDNKNYQSP